MKNVLWVTGAEAETDAVLGAAEAAQGDLAHRKAFVEHEALGAALEPALVAAGWTAEREVVLALRRPRDRDPERGLATETDEATLVAAEGITGAAYGDDADLVAQLSRARASLRAVARGRGFVGEIDGRLAAHATLFSDGATAQIEDVATLETHRRRGLARAVCSAAIGAALAAGHDLVFLVADVDGPARELYEKLGFDPVGSRWAFTRQVAEAAS